MKKIFTLLATALTLNAAAQNELYSNGATLQVNTGCIVQVNGNATFTTGSTLTNDGTVNVTGNITNNQTMSAANAGNLIFNGTAAQTLSGSSTYYAKNVTVNNSAGVTISNPLKVDGAFTFTNGIVTAATTANAVTFTTNGTVSGVADASHINGYVVKEGTGSFTYPVGDGTKYQKVDVNPSINGSGIQVKYNATNAGAGSFTNGGTEATALVSYNTNEHWDVTPLTTATGTVTIYWDGYKDSYGNAVNQRKVAHLTGSNWLNEGTTGTGTTASGSVTSNAVSTWSPFALGSIGNVLPINWLSINGNVNANKQAQLNWQVAENNVASYQIEKSVEGLNYVNIGNVISKGDGTNNYTYADATPLTGNAYYRIKQTDRDGRYSYSSIMRLNVNIGSSISFYPNPVKDVVTISNAKAGTRITLADINGNVLQQINVTQSSFTIKMGNYCSGMYLLKTSDGQTQKIIKQ